MDTLNTKFWFQVPRQVRESRRAIRQALQSLAVLDQRLVGETEACVSNRSVSLVGKVRGLLMEFDFVTHPGVLVDIQMILVIAVATSIIHVTTWALYHILADKELHEAVMAEIDTLVGDDGDDDKSNPTVNMGKVHANCPQLLAVWYELLRLLTEFPIARGVNEDTTFGPGCELKKGSLLLAPLRLQHYDPGLWGADVNTFHHHRFLNDGGRLDGRRVKDLRAFGVAGLLQCPGRFLAFSVALSTIVRVLLTFEFRTKDGSVLHVPMAGKTGMPVIAQPIAPQQLVIRRHDRIKDVQMSFDDMRLVW